MCSDKILISTLWKKTQNQEGKFSSDLITFLDLSQLFHSCDRLPVLVHFQRLPCPLKSHKSLNTQTWAAAQGGIQQLFSFSVLPAASQHSREKVLHWRSSSQRAHWPPAPLASQGMIWLQPLRALSRASRAASPPVGYQQLKHLDHTLDHKISRVKFPSYYVSRAVEFPHLCSTIQT